MRELYPILGVNKYLLGGRALPNKKIKIGAGAFLDASDCPFKGPKRTGSIGAGVQLAEAFSFLPNYACMVIIMVYVRLVISD